MTSGSGDSAGREPKIVCVGLNYRDHAAEGGQDLPAAPLLFAKLPNTICSDGDAIVLPAGVGHVDAEAELAVVIGRTARNVGKDDAFDFVAGYTCANDVSARDLQFSDGQWFRGKGYDTFCPLGPALVAWTTRPTCASSSVSTARRSRTRARAS